MASDNGYQDKNADESSNGIKEQVNVENGGAEDAETHVDDIKNASDDQKLPVENNNVGDSEPTVTGSSQMNNVDEPSNEDVEPTSDNVCQEGDASTHQPLEPVTQSATISRKIEVPNNKVCLVYVLLFKRLFSNQSASACFCMSQGM